MDSSITTTKIENTNYRQQKKTTEKQNYYCITAFYQSYCKKSILNVFFNKIKIQQAKKKKKIKTNQLSTFICALCVQYKRFAIQTNVTTTTNNNFT